MTSGFNLWFSFSDVFKHSAYRDFHAPHGAFPIFSMTNCFVACVPRLARLWGGGRAGTRPRGGPGAASNSCRKRGQDAGLILLAVQSRDARASAVRLWFVKSAERPETRERLRQKSASRAADMSCDLHNVREVHGLKMHP